MRYNYQPQGVCSTKISFDIENNKVKNVEYTGGCNGNLKAIAKLIDNEDVDLIINKLKGNECGLRKTSCADQLAQALQKAKEKENH
ncbi:MAG: TIGR03905 family TSCPD domain-containing protein [Bacilli bacterium]|jgi:uncharacterized protein (TIGR03905 family)|nr:TIGR03905 family TSCPD domain-containing protein [Bacilli bacterium]